jgi:hypothetical protein
MSTHEKKKNREKTRVGPKYGDSRDNLWAECDCNAPLAEAELKPGATCGTAHGVYACGSKYLAWADPKQRPVCVRACGKRETAEPGKAKRTREEVTPEQSVLRFVRELCEVKPQAHVEASFLYTVYRGFSKEVVKVEPAEEELFFEVIRGSKVKATLRGGTLCGIHIAGIREDVVKRAVAETLREMELEEENWDSN